MKTIAFDVSSLRFNLVNGRFSNINRVGYIEIIKETINFFPYLKLANNKITKRAITINKSKERNRILSI